MQCRNFQITLISAEGLSNVREIGSMKVYAKVSMAGEPETEQQTPVDRHGETNPKWNYTFKYNMAEAAFQQDAIVLIIQLYCERLLGDRYIGEVNMSLKKLFDRACSETLNYDLINTRGTAPSKGTLAVSYSFGEPVTVEIRKVNSLSHFFEGQ